MNDMERNVEGRRARDHGGGPEKPLGEKKSLEDESEKTIEKKRRPDSDRGLAQRTADSKVVFRATRDPRAAIREYCRGNRWLEENAKAVGNW